MEVKTTDITCLLLRIGITRIPVGSAARLQSEAEPLTNHLTLRMLSLSKHTNRGRFAGAVLRLAQEHGRNAVIEPVEMTKVYPCNTHTAFCVPRFPRECPRWLSLSKPPIFRIGRGFLQCAPARKEEEGEL